MKDESDDIIIKDILRRLHRLEDSAVDISSMLYKIARWVENTHIDNTIEGLGMRAEEIDEEREGK